MTTKDTTAEKVAHTPGPWTARESALSQNNDLWFISADVLRVAETFSAENARLIAAAPELLEACQEFVRKCECGEAWSKRSYAQMTAAIAKAEGR